MHHLLSGKHKKTDGIAPLKRCHLQRLETEQSNNDHQKSDTPRESCIRHWSPWRGCGTSPLRRNTDAPLAGHRIEVWQFDMNGKYLHSGDRLNIDFDAAFQGFGHDITASDRSYVFRTIKRVTYPGRTPHILVKVFDGTREILTTQFYIDGQPARPHLQSPVRKRCQSGIHGLHFRHRRRGDDARRCRVISEACTRAALW